MPAALGSSRFMIAEWSPGVAGLIVTGRSTGTFNGRAIVAGELNVPSLPTQRHSVALRLRAALGARNRVGPRVRLAWPGLLRDRRCRRRCPAARGSRLSTVLTGPAQRSRRADIRRSRFHAVPCLQQAIALAIDAEAARIEEPVEERLPGGAAAGLILCSGLFGSADQQCGGASRLRRSHRRAVHQLGSRAEARKAGTPAGLPHRGRRNRRTRSDDLRLESAILTRTVRGEVVQVVSERSYPRRNRAASSRDSDTTHADDGSCHRRIADRIHPGTAVAGRNEHLHLVLLDQAVVELGASVIAVVERREPADRHVDHIDVRRLDG